MDHMEEIQSAIERLTSGERARLAMWLRVEFGEAGYFVSEAVPPLYDAPRGPRQMSVEEYLAFEETSPLKHEYVAGRIFTMSGVSVRHNEILDNFIAAFNGHFGSGPCRARSSGIKVPLRIGRDDIYYYPDVTVTCDRLTGEEKSVNPKLIVEVLSPSTEDTDRREKALNYRHLASLEEYVLAAQREPEGTIFRRSENWEATTVKSADAPVELRSVGLSLSLERIYAGVFR